MPELGPVDWPPRPIRTERLLLRETEARDRAAYIELFASPDVRTHLGGPRRREGLEERVPEVPGRYAGVFAVEVAGSMIGTVSVDRRADHRPGHVRPEGNELELSYMFLPEAWGLGYATEAARAVLAWAAGMFPDEPVVLCTQSANRAAVRLAERLGFVEVERFSEFDAEQWFGMRAAPGR